jgi:Vacuolar sorting-associated protein 13, N-terminal
VNLTVAVLAIQLEDNQLREFLSLQANMANFANLEESSSYRPEVPVMSDPRAWWRLGPFFVFLFFCVCFCFCFVLICFVLFFYQFLCITVA